MIEVIIFISVVISMGLFFSIIHDPKGTEWKSMLGQMTYFSNEIKWLKQRREEQLKETGLLKIEQSELKKENEELKFLLSRFKEEIEIFRDQVAETREKQIVLREILSAKRPVIKLTGLQQQQKVETGPKKVKNKLGRGLHSLL
jgi:uncharacterized membrane protein